MHVAGKPKPTPELYALPGPAALSADNLSGHGISVLVLFRLFLDSLLQTIRINDGVCSFEDLPAYDGLMMILHVILVFLSVINMPVKPIIRKSLLEDHVSGILLITDHAGYDWSFPPAATL